MMEVAPLPALNRAFTRYSLDCGAAAAGGCALIRSTVCEERCR